MSDEPDWLLIVLGSPEAIDDTKKMFAGSDWQITTQGESAFLSAPEFRNLDDANAIFDVGSKLLSAINLAREIVAPGAEVLGVGGAGQRISNGQIRRHFIAKLEPARFRVRLMPVEFIVSGANRPVRAPRPPFAVRIAKAVRTDEAVETAAAALAQRPLTWAALFVAHETINGLTSPSGKRAAYGHYESNGWAKVSEIVRFRRTANFHRHGLPRDPLPDKPMSFEEAENLIRQCFDNMIESMS